MAYDPDEWPPGTRIRIVSNHTDDMVGVEGIVTEPPPPEDVIEEASGPWWVPVPEDEARARRNGFSKSSPWYSPVDTIEKIEDVSDADIRAAIASIKALLDYPPEVIEQIDALKLKLRGGG